MPKKHGNGRSRARRVWMQRRCESPAEQDGRPATRSIYWSLASRARFSCQGAEYIPDTGTRSACGVLSIPLPHSIE